MRCKKSCLPMESDSEEEEAGLAWVAKEALHGDGVATRNQSQRSHIPSRIGVEIMLGCVMLEEIFSQHILLLTLLVHGGL